MYLSRVKVSGLRASAEMPMSCDLPGRFSVMIGPNGAGKTTLTDALYLAHPGNRFPVLPRPTSAALASPDAGVERSIDITYNLADDLQAEGRAPVRTACARPASPRRRSRSGHPTQ